MHAAEHLNLKQAGFIHTPYLSSQIERFTKAGHAIPHGASLSEGDFLRGVKLILQVCANKLNA